MSFMDNLKDTLDTDFNISVTENGALGYRTSGKKLLDMNFNVTSFRNQSEQDIIKKFSDVFYENKLLAIKWLFFASDVRGGLGERRLFRVCFKYLGQNHPELIKPILNLVPLYNRWDNLLCLLDSPLIDDVISLIKNQLEEDMRNMEENKPISLCAKWLPSANASSKESKKLARIIIHKLDITEKRYRKTLSKLRSYLNVVEILMSKREWSYIDYSIVPSRANLIYNQAFLRNDEQRRKEYLESLKKGETKINAGVLFPHDIVHQYFESHGWNEKLKPKDDTLEQLWNALPDFVNGASNTICVSDGSGSMTSTIGNSAINCLDVANALTIYFAEHSTGQFQDTYITFSQNPKIVSFSNAACLRDKIEIAMQNNEVANTNIEAVFDLILCTALNKKMKQEDLPQNILILSDMEFDYCVVDNTNQGTNFKRLFEQLSQRYKNNGYKLPRLIFWNICSRTGTIPIRENELGVALISGFSPTIVNMILSNSTDPYECLLEQINQERYQPIEDTIKHLI